MGHEYCGIVEDVGSAVMTIKPGQFVIGAFFVSDNTCSTATPNLLAASDALSTGWFTVPFGSILPQPPE
jgi:Zn-dependent alcohol dehydrogenase